MAGGAPSRKLLHEFYRFMLLTRRFEARISALGKEGKLVGGFFSSLGQEAISVGTTLALKPEDWVAPMIRNIGTVLVRGYTPAELFSQFLARRGGPNRGKDSNLHFGDPAHGVVGCISHLGPLVPIMTGVAMAGRMRGQGRVTMTYLGEGGCSVGDFHEGLNLAAVQKAPFVLVVENNGWSYSTPLESQTLVKDIASRAVGYGIRGLIGDGNDVVEVWKLTRRAVEDARAGGGPQLLEFKTFRRKGHAEHDDAKYVPREQVEAWTARDPIDRFEAWLRDHGKMTDAERRAIHGQIDRELAEGERIAAADRPPDPAEAIRGVYADDAIVAVTPWARREGDPVTAEPTEVVPPDAGGDVTYLEAIRRALFEEMERDDRVFCIGEDIGSYGGAFRVTQGLLEKFGAARVIDTPIAESATVGAALGAALAGMRPVVEFQFIDFISCAFNMIVQFVAKMRWRTGQAAPMVLRGPCGAGVHAGPFHSQTPEMWFVHTPGLKVVMPATPADARGLLKAAIRDDDPVVFLEHKYLYRRIKGSLPGGEGIVPIGRAALRAEGDDLTIVTYGAMVHTVMAALPDLGLSAEVIDLRTLCPLDRGAVVRSVRKTHKLMIVHEDTRTGGIAGEIAAVVNEEAFDALDGPIVRVTAPDAPVPFSPNLEEAFLPGVADVTMAARKLHRY